ncbi:hypothetical protein Agub_g2578 [Astrephomene gubernaculifera]|uniref:Kinesin-like protein n=1 Tax=Astrephomene gubernaculifera TaxID=47775 RepID=A0AAD3HID9_9CHLO|nr:hypothetical protein Agub_g2578 [Astrephomene gubernaculifera]
MAEQDGSEPSSAIQVCVRVRPLNPRERDEGLRACVSFDEETKQVVLSAVDKNTLLQLRGATAKGYAFDRRYGQDITSDAIYDDCVAQLVEAVFKGYNATVLAYGQTGSGKTHTMAGGQGIHGVVEEGVTPRVIRHIFALAEAIRKKEKPGEKTQVSAYGLELYNEDLRDLALAGGRDETAKGWDGKGGCGSTLKLQERPVGKDGRVVPEVIGVTERVVSGVDELLNFFNLCMDNRSTSSTKLNDRSSRSHAIFTITIQRTVVEVLNELGSDLKAKVRTSEFSSKLHLVDLAGSERVKRSGVTGKELKEATHINSGLLALGNVIVALAGDDTTSGGGKDGKAEKKKATHVPYRDSKLTRLLQDSLGGNSLTVLISCISPSESDFEETNNTLKYANRACKIKNQPLPNRFTTLEEDLLPVIPTAGMGCTLGMMQLQALLEDHERLKEVRERRERERREKEAKRTAALAALREEQMKAKGFQRLRATQYDELRRRLAGGAAASIPTDQVIGDELLKGFGTRLRLSAVASSVDGLAGVTSSAGPGSARRQPHRPSSSRGRGTAVTADDGPSTPSRPRPTASTAKSVGKSSFAAWLASQEAGAGAEGATGNAESEYGGTDDFFVGGEDGEGDVVTEDFVGGEGGDESMFADEERTSEARRDDGGESMFADDASGEGGAAAAAIAKSKFRRAQKAGGGPGRAAAGGSEASLTELEREGTGDAGVNAEAASADDGVGADDGAGGYDLLDEGEVPKLLARFKVNQHDTLAVFKACTKEDFKDVISLLPENTPLPASDKMTYLLARLEVNPGRDMAAALLNVATGEATMKDAVGPAVGCLMATFGTNMIASCIFDFEDPEELRYYGVDERIELWGLQIPHTSVRPMLADGLTEEQALAAAEASKDNTITWSSVDRLNMSIGLLYALCNHAIENGIRCGFCVPRPQLLKRWMQAGVKMEQVKTALTLIYPQTAHDYEYYRASTVAWFMVAEVKAKLERVLGIVH